MRTNKSLKITIFILVILIVGGVYLIESLKDKKLTTSKLDGGLSYQTEDTSEVVEYRNTSFNYSLKFYKEDVTPVNEKINGTESAVDFIINVPENLRTPYGSPTVSIYASNRYKVENGNKIDTLDDVKKHNYSIKKVGENQYYYSTADGEVVHGESYTIVGDNAIVLFQFTNAVNEKMLESFKFD